jgi:hypothetical protein
MTCMPICLNITAYCIVDMLVTSQNKNFEKFVTWSVGALCAVKIKQPGHAGKAKAGALLLYAHPFDKLLIKATHNHLR